MRGLQDYTRRKLSRPDTKRASSATAGDSDLAWELLLDSLIFAAQAEVQWLYHVEARIACAAAARASDQADNDSPRSADGAAEGSGDERVR